MMTGLLTLGALGASLSVDAFAAAIGKGAGSGETRWRDAIRVGAVFGFFEAITPAIGWVVGLALSAWIASVDHWVAFALLVGVGGNMIRMPFKADDAAEGSDKTRPHGLYGLVLTALATSIDATAVGVSLAVMQVNILIACLIIGGITTVGATAGGMIWRQAGACFGPDCQVPWGGGA